MSLTIVPGGVIESREGIADVEPGATHSADIQTLDAEGVFEGTLCEGDLFCPDEPVARWVMAVWMVRILDSSDPTATGVSPFEDVDAAEWWAPFAERLLYLGVTRGCSAKPAKYCPEQFVTRAQMASFLVRGFPVQAGTLDSGFTDTAGSGHTADIEALWNSGITRGCSANPARYCPEQFVTRAQMASFLVRGRTAQGATSESDVEAVSTGGGGSGSGGGGGGSTGQGRVSVNRISPPGIPRSLSVTSGDTRLVVSWGVPARDGGATITGYQVAYKANDAVTWNFHNNSDSTPITDTSATIGSLTNGIAYDISVAAVNSEGTGTATTGSGTPRGKPDAPQNLEVTAGDRQLELSWNPPTRDGGSPITGYQVAYKANDAVTWNFHNNSDSTPITDTSATIERLVNTVDYDIRVVAVNAVGEGAETTSIGTPVGTPEAPDLSVTIGDTELILAWDPPANNGGYTVTGYEVAHKATTSQTWIFHNSSDSTPITNTTATIGSLTNDTRYDVSVAAVNSEGTGTAATGSGTPISLTDVPSAPGSLSLTSGHTQLVVSWSVPTSDGGAAITGYQVAYKANDAVTWNFHNNSDSTPITDTSATIGSLTNGIAYDISVAAVNSEGAGAATTGSGTPRGKPDAPQNLEVTAGDRQLELSWEEPDNNGGFTITGYQVTYKATTSQTWIFHDSSDSTPITDTSATIASLTNATEYDVSVAAVNSGGTGPPLADMGTPIGKPSAPQMLNSVSGDRQLELSWEEPSNNNGAAVTGYSVEYRSDADTTWTQHSANTDTPTTITGLTNGDTYHVRVRAVNSEGSGPEVTTTGVPSGTPGSPTYRFVEKADDRLTIWWHPPSDDGGTRVVSHVVEYKKSTDTIWLEIPDTHVPTTITGLEDGVTYEYRVSAVNAAGKRSQPFTTQSSTVTVLSPNPRNLIIVEGTGKLTVSWDAPDSGTGRVGSGYEKRSIPGYKVEYKVSTASTWTEHSASATSPTTITGLTDGTQYDVRVTSDPTDGRMGMSSESGTPSDAAGPPQNITLDPGATQLALSWEAPASLGGLTASSYKVEYKVSTASTWTEHSASATSPITITGLTDGTQYDVRVTVTYSDSSTLSQSASGTPGTPGAPRNVAVVVGGGSDHGASTGGKLEVSWEAPTNPSSLTSYTVQWRKTNTDEGYTSTRQATATTLSHTITGLDNNTHYSVRVMAVNASGAGPPSAEVTGMPLRSDTQLKDFVLSDVVEAIPSAKWLSFAVDYLTSLHRPYKVGPIFVSLGIIRGQVTSFCDRRDIHDYCLIGGMIINNNYHRNIDTIIHELGHVYTLTTPDNLPPAVGAGWLYMSLLDTGVCYKDELYPDALTVLARPSYSPIYWTSCRDVPSEPTEATDTVMTSVAAGEMPAWFTDTYQGGDGAWSKSEMEEIWEDVKGIPLTREGVEGNGRQITIWAFRDLFGGYCEPAYRVTDDAFSEDSDLRNPWKDGGCVPAEPQNVTVTSGANSLVVSWEAPEYDGGSPITRYRVRWKSGDQDYSTLREAILDADSLTNLEYTITSLDPGSSYTVMVTAKNKHFGKGNGAEATGSPTE